MKKLATAVISALFMLTAVNAYNPPVGTEDLYLVSSPLNISGGLSVTGGGLFNAGSDSLIVNPALAAKEQRINLNLGYTFFYSGGYDSLIHKIGQAFQLGIMIPTKLYIVSGFVDGIFVGYNEMNLGDSINMKVGISKEITDKLDVGLSLNGGIKLSSGFDWSLGANIGAVYNYGEVGFMKNFRLGFSALNLGKGYTNSTPDNGKYAIKTFDDKGRMLDSTPFPTLATVKLGASATMFENDVLKVGTALDFTTPLFQNQIVDANVMLAIKEKFIISIGEKYNLKESMAGHANYIPSIAFLFTFSFNVKSNSYLENNGWSESEMTTSAGYKNMYSTVNAFSVCADIDLGMKDTEGPKIEIFEIKEAE